MGAGVLAEVDVAIVGSGIVGLAHAVEALRRGARVAVVDRDRGVVGASIRNFGHACSTAQAGVALDRARRARVRWLEMAEVAGFWAAPAGTVVLARAADEMAVLEEFAAERADEVELLDPAGVRALVPTSAADLTGGARFPRDLRVNPREAVPALARWVAAQPAASLLTATACWGLDDAGIRTSRGLVRAERVVVCVNHDIDHLFPELAASHGVERCALQMLRVRPPAPLRIEPAVLSGSSLLRYRGFAACPSLPALRARLAAEQPQLLDADVNLMLTQLPDGDLLLGDTHVRAPDASPFTSAAWDELLLSGGERLLGCGPFRVVERWQGVYASGPDEFLVAAPHPSVRVVSVTTGIGMTVAFGLAEDVLDDW